LRFKKHQYGLASVIIMILSVLVLIAFSRYFDVFETENVSEAKAVAKAFESSVGVIHLEWAELGNQGDSLEINGVDVGVTANGWVKQPDSNVAGCVTIWHEVLPDYPDIDIYNTSLHVEGWSVGGGPGLCYFINQGGIPFDVDETPYFSYIPDNGQVTRFNM